MGKRPLRITGVDGTEIGAGSDAEYFRNGLYGIFGGGKAQVASSEQDVFGRDLGNLEVEGLDWRHVLYESGVSENWGKYGFDKGGSEEDERYKWYAGKTQSTNIEAYELLESGVEPSTIISDEDYSRVQLLRKSFKSHLADANEGVLDKEDAMLVVQELFKNPELLVAAQKRQWYDMARTSNVGKTMMAAWNDPYTQATIKRQYRTQTLDVKPSVDTSVLGMVRNAYDQQFNEKVNANKVDMGSALRGTPWGEGNTEADVDLYIQQNDIAPDVAAKMYDVYETDGFLAATDFVGNELISQETTDQAAQIEKKTGATYVATMLVNEALPYVIDPTAWVGGAGAGKLAANITYSKVASPLIQKGLQGFTVGSATGLTESMIYTTNNYKVFSNEELLKIWATDAGFGGAFGSIFAIGAHGVNRYGARAKSKAAGEGLDDIEFKRSTDEVRDRMDEMQEEIADELNNGTKPVTAEVDVEARPTTPKPEPVPEPTPDVEGKPKAESTEPQVDTRTPEQIEADEDAWQAAEMDLAIEHQSTVRAAIEEADKQHNIIAKVHRALGKGLGLQEFASKLIRHQDNKMSYIGTHILETGVGFSGKFKRKASAAMIKDSIYTRNVGNLNKAYVDSVKGWAMQQGKGTYKQFKAAWEGGKVNDIAREFHKAVYRHQEMLQMGKTPDSNEFVEKYVKELNRVNDELFYGRVEANVKGFSKDRQIKNYIPHVWKKVKVAEVVKRHGKQAVLELLTESIEQAKKAGKIADSASTSELAERQLNWINGLGDAMEYSAEVGAGTSGRGKSRIPLDFTVEKNGLSMLDLVDTDIPTVMDSYIQRAGADIGISDATGGLIRSEGDFDKFLTPDSDADKLLAQDARDMLYGRPTRTGMSPEMRSMMDIVTVQQMGGIGVAQLAETGTMAQRMVVNYMSQPKIAKKIWQMAGEDINDKGVMSQVRSIAAVNDNMEYINRYSVNNIDQAQVDELSNLRAASIDAVDKVTLGAYKAQFGRMLGSLSGVNAVQKAQSRLLQASFSVDVARGFKFGKGTSTPQRLIDLGLTEDGFAAKNIREFAEFDKDGFPTNFNFDQWSKEALDEFVHAMNREEAQLMPRVMAGELPVFMNKPLWQAIMQFRKTPLAFMSKGAQRNLQFADREAVLGTVLNSMTAGVTRYAKLAGAGAAYAAISDEEFQAPSLVDDFDRAQPYNYVSNFGILGDAYSLSQSWSKAYQQKDGIESLWEGATAVPVLSAIDNGYHAVQGDPTAIKKATPLNTLPLVTEVTNAVIRNMEQD